MRFVISRAFVRHSQADFLKASVKTSYFEPANSLVKHRELMERLITGGRCAEIGAAHFLFAISFRMERHMSDSSRE